MSKITLSEAAKSVTAKIKVSTNGHPPASNYWNIRCPCWNLNCPTQKNMKAPLTEKEQLDRRVDKLADMLSIEQEKHEN